MTITRAARRFGATAERETRPCARCGDVFTPPVLSPGREVCAACRDASKHPGRTG